MITGFDLIKWGFKPGPWFGHALEMANRLAADLEDGPGLSEEKIIEHIRTLEPKPVETVELRTNNIHFGTFLDPETDAERENFAAVVQHMDALMRVPTIKAGAIMPDACPSGSAPGTIPVGGVVACEDAIHPGFHSADICCSMAISVFKRDGDPKKLLDAVQQVTHFGPGRRENRITNFGPLLGRMISNPLLKDLTRTAIDHMGTQGDGNHFAFVGRRRSDGRLALVTHHGSRGLGAQLYKIGMRLAQKHTAIHAPRVPKHNAWIKASSREGEQYWAALQLVREWTKANHRMIHSMTQHVGGNAIDDWFWNEHNFVFQKSDGLFYHAKGATPSFAGFSPDDDGRTLIPLNMSQPILVAEHANNPGALGFAPHGAGRNFSRTQHLKMQGENGLARELAMLHRLGLDIRSYCGTPDHSELPSAYKSAAAVQAQIDKYRLAKIVDYIDPYGSIMAGDWEKDALWRKRK